MSDVNKIISKTISVAQSIKQMCGPLRSSKKVITSEDLMFHDHDVEMITGTGVHHQACLFSMISTRTI